MEVIHLKNSKLLSIAVLTLTLGCTVACDGKFKTKKEEKSFVTGESHQQKVVKIVAVDSQLRKLNIDVTDLKHSQSVLDEHLYASRKQDLDKISSLLQQYIDIGSEMIQMGDNDESTVTTVENAKELNKVSTSFAVTLQ